MFRPFALACLLVLPVAGCTPVQWVKPGATEEGLRADAAQCQQDAWREARLRTWYQRPIGSPLVVDGTGRRLALGPVLPDPFADPLLEEVRLAQLCMRSRGYELRADPGAAKPAETIQPSPSGDPAGKP